MVLNLVIENDSVGFLRRQPRQAHGACCSRHQVNSGYCRGSYTGRNKHKTISQMYFPCRVFSYSMPSVCPYKSKSSSEPRLCEEVCPIISMQNHSPLMLKLSLPESLGRQEGCLILLKHENRTAKLINNLWYIQFPSVGSICGLPHTYRCRPHFFTVRCCTTA